MRKTAYFINALVLFSQEKSRRDVYFLRPVTCQKIFCAKFLTYAKNELLVRVVNYRVNAKNDDFSDRRVNFVWVSLKKELFSPAEFF